MRAKRAGLPSVGMEQPPMLFQYAGCPTRRFCVWVWSPCSLSTKTSPRCHSERSEESLISLWFLKQYEGKARRFTERWNGAAADALSVCRVPHTPILRVGLEPV